MSAPFPPLKNHVSGPDMNPDPINVSIERAAYFFARNRAVFVTLEPGDATRYDLLLVPHCPPFSHMPSWGTDGVICTVVRYVGGHPVEADTFRLPFQHWDMNMLGMNNEWTRTILGWWLEGFGKLVDSAIAALTEERKAIRLPSVEGDSLTAQLIETG